MKKFVCLLSMVVLLLAFSLPKADAQTNLFKGITSGISKSDFFSFCYSTKDFEKTKNPKDSSYVKAVIENRTYLISPYFNKKNQLYGLVFNSTDTYEWVDYEPNVKENAVELFTLLSAKYGEATFNEWASWTEIPKNKNKIVCTFESNTIAAIILVTEYSEKYGIELQIIDSKFKDEVKKDSGGF